MKKLFKKEQTVYAVALIDRKTGEHFVTKHTVVSCGFKNLILHPNVKIQIDNGTFTDDTGNPVFISGKRCDAFYHGRMASEKFIKENGLSVNPKVSAV